MIVQPNTWPPADQAIMQEIADHMAKFMPHTVFAFVLVHKTEPLTMAVAPTSRATHPEDARRLVFALRAYASKLEAFLKQSHTEDMSVQGEKRR